MLLSKEKKRLLFNASSLYLIRGINMLFPLLLIPVIIERLGLREYGVYSIVMSIINVLIVILDYGFNYTATKEIARVKDNRKEFSEYFSNVFFTKVILLVLVLLVLTFLSLFEKFEGFGTSFFICSLTLVGFCLNPGWLYQGLEKSYINAAINIVFKLFTIAVLYFFLSKSNGINFVFFWYSIGFLGWGIIGFLYSKFLFSIKLRFSGFSNILKILRSTSDIFIATFISSIYLSGLPLILKIFNIPVEEIASYSIAERIIRGLCSFISPLSIALIPYFVRKTDTLNEVEIHKKYLAIGLKLSLPFLLLSSIIYVCVDKIIYFIHIFKSNLSVDKYSILDIKIQSFIIFFSVFNSILGITSLVSLGKESEFRKIMILVLTLSILLFYILLEYSLKNIGSIVAVSTEGFLALFLFLFIIYQIYHTRWKKN